MRLLIFLANINDLSPLLEQNPDWKEPFGDFVEGKELNSYKYRDIHKLLAIRDEIYNHISRKDIDVKYEPIINNIYDIIDKFKVDYDDMDCRFADENTQEAISDFIGSGDSTYILQHDEVTGNADDFDRYEEYDSSWFNDFKNEIRKAYFHGCNEITVCDDTFLEKYGYYDLLLYDSAKVIVEKASDILNDLDEYIKRKTDNKIVDLWKPLLLDITKDNSIPIGNQGSGIQRLCAIFVNSVRCYRDDSLYNIPTIFAIDEIEISLHPSQQRMFVNILNDLSNNFQIITTTHSPYIVNELDEKSVCILKRESQTDVNGNPIEPVTTSAMNKRIIKYPSMAEVNYLAFDEPSITYHQELYGQIEVECMGESNGNKLDEIIYDIWKKDNTVWNTLISKYNRIPNRPFEIKVKNEFSSPDNDGKDKNGNTLYYYVPYCVRNAIDHPGDMNKQWKNNISVVNLSIKMLIKIYKAVEKAENSFLPTINSKTSDLDDYGHETFKCSGASDNNEHSLTYWVKYQIDHPNECLIKQNRRGQDNPHGEIKNKINFVKAMYDIDSDWLTK